MKKQIFHLSTCSTCKRILSELGDLSSFELVDIKERNMSREELDEIRFLNGGEYSDLFSKRAMKYRGMGLHERELSEEEIAQLITKEYTFLKRPVIRIGEKVFVGNSKKVVQAAKEELGV